MAKKAKKLVKPKKAKNVSLRIPLEDYQWLVEEAILDGDDGDDEVNVSKQIRKAIRKYRVSCTRNETIGE